MPKGVQNGARIDAKMHQKSMQKTVTEKVKEHHENMRFFDVQNHVNL